MADCSHVTSQPVLLREDFALGLLLAHKTWQYCNLIGLETRSCYNILHYTVYLTYWLGRFKMQFITMIHNVKYICSLITWELLNLIFLSPLGMYILALTLSWFFFCKYTKHIYRSGTVNSNTVNSKFRLIRSYCEIFFYNFPNIPCLKYTVNSNFHLIRSKTLPTNDFELTVPDL